ncbi:hypothetical protein E2562_024501, partial [Oryza meyeriana var. granulata]
AEEELNLNATALEFDFCDSPVEKRSLEQCWISRSPWFYGLKHPQRHDARTLFNWLATADSAELGRSWIMHPSPRFIELTGHILKQMFIDGTQLSYDAIDLGIRRIRQLDDEMYKCHNGVRWRHFIESDFAVQSLAGEDPVRSKSVRDQFLGESVTYNTMSCRMAVSTKFHDMHSPTVAKLQECIAKCIDTFYTGWYPDWEGWITRFFAVDNQEAIRCSQNSGIIALLAARDFDGSKISSLVGQDYDSVLSTFKMTMLYELLSIKGNFAKVPSAFVQSVED